MIRCNVCAHDPHRDSSGARWWQAMPLAGRLERGGWERWKGIGETVMADARRNTGRNRWKGGYRYTNLERKCKRLPSPVLNLHTKSLRNVDRVVRFNISSRVDSCSVASRRQHRLLFDGQNHCKFKSYPWCACLLAYLHDIQALTTPFSELWVLYLNRSASTVNLGHAHEKSRLGYKIGWNVWEMELLN